MFHFLKKNEEFALLKLINEGKTLQIKVCNWLNSTNHKFNIFENGVFYEERNILQPEILDILFIKTNSNSKNFIIKFIYEKKKMFLKNNMSFSKPNQGDDKTVPEERTLFNPIMTTSVQQESKSISDFLIFPNYRKKEKEEKGIYRDKSNFKKTQKVCDQTETQEIVLESIKFVESRIYTKMFVSTTYCIEHLETLLNFLKVKDILFFYYVWFKEYELYESENIKTEFDLKLFDKEQSLNVEKNYYVRDTRNTKYFNLVTTDFMEVNSDNIESYVKRLYSKKIINPNEPTQTPVFLLFLLENKLNQKFLGKTFLKNLKKCLVMDCLNFAFKCVTNCEINNLNDVAVQKHVYNLYSLFLKKHSIRSTSIWVNFEKILFILGKSNMVYDFMPTLLNYTQICKFNDELIYKQYLNDFNEKINIFKKAKYYVEDDLETLEKRK